MKEITESVINKLLSYYDGKGFGLLPKVASFERKREVLKQRVALAPTYSYDDVVFMPFFAITHEAIQNLKETILTLRTGPKGSTIVLSQGKYLANKFDVADFDDWTAYRLESENQIDEMVNHHINFMEMVGWNFFEPCSTIAGIDDFLNAPILSISFKKMTEEERMVVSKSFGLHLMVNGIIAAWLNKNPQLEKIVNNYRLIVNPYMSNVLEQLLVGLNNYPQQV